MGSILIRRNINTVIFMFISIKYRVKVRLGIGLRVRFSADVRYEISSY